MLCYCNKKCLLITESSEYRIKIPKMECFSMLFCSKLSNVKLHPTYEKQAQLISMISMTGLVSAVQEL